MTPRPAPHLIRWFLRTTGYAGICLAPWGIFILAEHLHSRRLIRHEQAHWRQYQRMGVVRWAITYLFYNVRYGYWDNPLEVEARAAELSS
jgi:purine-cytosine permease-like protein